MVTSGDDQGEPQRLDSLQQKNREFFHFTEYTLSDNSYTLFNDVKPHVLFIMFMFCLLDRNIHICVSCFRAVQIWFFEVQFSNTDPWLFNMAPHGKELSEDLRIRMVALHKDGGYTKFSNSLELSYNTVARVIERFSKTGFTRNRPHNGP